MKRSVCYSLSSLVGLIMAAGVAHSQLGHQPPSSSDALLGTDQGGIGFGAAGESEGDDANFGSESYEVGGRDFGGFGSPPTFTVLSPDGQPEEGAFVHAFDGRPIRLISDGTETIRCRRLSTVQIQPSRGAEQLDQVTDDAGRFHTTRPLLLIEGESGYLITSLKEMEQQPTHVQLEAWSTVQGSVSVNGKPLKNVRVYAYWESFPHLPEMIRLSPETAMQGPMMASYQTSAPVDDSGTFELKMVPQGRIRFCVGGSLNEQLEPEWMSNLVWWKTVKKTEENLLPGPVVVQDFRALRVDGSVKMSDELLSARTRVVSRAGRAVVSTLPVGLLFRQSDETERAVDALINRTLPGQLPELMKRAVVWARPGGERETRPETGTALISDAGKFVCYLEKADYEGDLMLQVETPAGVDPRWAVVNSATLQFTDPQDDGDVQLPEVSVPQVSFTMPTAGVTAVDYGDTAFDAGDEFLEMSDAGFRPNAQPVNPADPRFINDIGPSDNPSDVAFRPQPDGFQPLDNSLADNLPRDVMMDMPPSSPPGDGFSDFGDLAMPDNVPFQNARQNRRTNSPLESSIASLVTDILAAGDRRTRAQLKQPLKDLLLKKFDAEQQAREALVDQLTRRLAAASKQVKQRAAGREQIVNEQLQRILGLPEDEFDLLAEPEMRDDFGDNLEQPLLRSQPLDFDPPVTPDSRLPEPAELRPSLNEPRRDPLSGNADADLRQPIDRQRPIDRPAELPRPAEREPNREPASLSEPEPAAEPELVPDGSDFNRLPEPSDPAVPSAN
ncbi:MAG: hypothetical protein NXI04_23515 [Planctomycetaceae bacterium]|nr:hypothetical protein [Planctomycetaceae bacterium]